MMMNLHGGGDGRGGARESAERRERVEAHRCRVRFRLLAIIITVIIISSLALLVCV